MGLTSQLMEESTVLSNKLHVVEEATVWVLVLTIQVMVVLEQVWVPKEAVEAVVAVMVVAVMVVAVTEEAVAEDMEGTRKMMLLKTLTQLHMTMMLIKNFDALMLINFFFIKPVWRKGSPDKLVYTGTMIDELLYTLFCTHEF